VVPKEVARGSLPCLPLAASFGAVTTERQGKDE